MKTVELVNEIKESLSQSSASQKDEVRVMESMLNDKDYKVGVYTKAGKVDEYCPYEDSRKMISNIISKTAKVPTAEAKILADEFEFGKSESTTMVNLSKEFVNTYVGTGRKLPLGGRENMNASLSISHVEAKTKQYPVGGFGSKDRGEVEIPAHDRLKAAAPCPVWKKAGNNN